MGKGTGKREGGGVRRGALSLQIEDPTPQDGWEQETVHCRVRHKETTPFDRPSQTTTERRSASGGNRDRAHIGNPEGGVAGSATILEPIPNALRSKRGEGGGREDGGRWIGRISMMGLGARSKRRRNGGTSRSTGLWQWPGSASPSRGAWWALYASQGPLKIPTAPARRSPRRDVHSTPRGRAQGVRHSPPPLSPPCRLLLLLPLHSTSSISSPYLLHTLGWLSSSSNRV